MAKVTSLAVNGKKLPVDVDSTVSLLSVIRNDLDNSLRYNAFVE